ncbi:MAG: hypothetical protein ACI97K_001254 [Glaciecola sp.]|jgi:hypothetical protein
MHGPMGESTYTKSVSNLVKYIHSNTPLKDSLFEQAQLYFEASDEKNETNIKLQSDIESSESSLQTADKKDKEKLLKKLNESKQALKKDEASQEEERKFRLNRVLEMCAKLLVLCEAENWEKTQVNSAKLLGTLQLLSPGEGAKLAQLNQKLKPAYKAVVALRLLDKLLVDEQISNQYINEHYRENRRYPEQEGDETLFQRDVAIPVIITAVFQDVGLLHPKAQLKLKGKDGSLDEFRVLDKDDRLSLLKLNHAYTLDYITNGLGMERYIGNSKAARTAFVHNEQKRLDFTRTLLASALKPKLGVGNLLKVPQIYASVIFSSKQSYNFMDLPKAGLLIIKAAKHAAISQVAADTLLAIIGHFPQGYGITYIPKDDDNKNLDRYEYAIVTGLNPEDPFVPICRVATRNLSFIPSGTMISVHRESNLYFSATKKKLEKINPVRLKEILRELASNFEERKDVELIPSYWNPYSFFGYVKMQNLWKKDWVVI